MAGCKKESSVVDTSTNTCYQQGKFLGKGGFAKCYEFKDTTTNEVFAVKIVSKSILLKPQHKSKMFQEIQIHSSLSHTYIVKFYHHFEDEKNIYIVLELCRKRSMLEMHKRRRILTVAEVRYFLKQIVLACKYLHENKIIHRDLKLGNLFINEDMQMKVGDFGLATRLTVEGERKQTLCGTPNYIAPEILSKKGHSYEVDLWSIGCIMYTLLVGVPPFETTSLKSTYNKIRRNEYLLPNRLDASAKVLIQKLLHPDPAKRPTPDEILSDNFLSEYIPRRLPTSCLTMQPRSLAKMMNISVASIVDKKNPLQENNSEQPPNLSNLKNATTKTSTSKENDIQATELKVDVENEPLPVSRDCHLKELRAMLESLNKCNPEVLFTGQPEDSQDPASVPFLWISKWVDYSDRYGIGYQLCDKSIAILFNDHTRLILLADGQNIHYIERSGDEFYHSMENFPPTLGKKVTLLKYFVKYMSENLLNAVDSRIPHEGDELTKVPYLRTWFRNETAMVFQLTNGTVQVNFFKDHTKIILCPIMGAISYIDEKKDFSVYKMKLIKKHGCPPELAARLRYAKLMVEKLFTSHVSEKRENISYKTNQDDNIVD